MGAVSKKSPEIIFCSVQEWQDHFLSVELAQLVDEQDDACARDADLSAILWDKIRSKSAHSAKEPKAKVGQS